jgi:hypothetical protein
MWLRPLAVYRRKQAQRVYARETVEFRVAES